jgi:putative addiction module component (TIGR02574 family)
MAMTVKELFEEARQLPPGQATELMDLLLVDALERPDAATDEAWRREISRRLGELERGDVAAVPGEQVMAEFRKIVGL